MSVIELKEKIARYMNHTEDEAFLQMIHQLIHYHQSSQDLDQANTEIEKGNYITHKQVIAESKTW